jgi:hypothetical protein
MSLPGSNYSARFVGGGTEKARSLTPFLVARATKPSSRFSPRFARAETAVFSQPE